MAAQLVLTFMPIGIPGVPSNVAEAADSGFLSPSTNVNFGWDNPSNAYVSDNNRSVADSSSDVVEYRNFGFSIPAGSTIDGVGVSIEGYTGGTRQAEISLSWNNGSNYTSGSGTGLKTTNMPGTSSASEANRTFGSATDKWGRLSWAVSDFSNTNFRIKLDATTGGGSNLYIDQVSVKVYYTSNTPPSIPILNAPANGSYTNVTTPTLDWADSVDSDGDAINYVLRIDGPSGFNEELTVGVSGYTHPGLPEDGLYTWKVKSYDGYGYSSWSDIWSFTLDTNAPAVPTHISPANSSYVNSSTSSANWGNVIDPSVPINYHYQSSDSSLINLDGSFQTTTQDSSWITNLNYLLAGLSEGSYFWHVKAKDAAENQSAWSNYWQFTVDNTPPVIDATTVDVGPVNMPTSLNGSATDNSGTDINYKWVMIGGPTGGAINFINDIDPATEAGATLDGEYTLELTATDKAGNSVSKQIKFTWDATVSPVKDLYLVTGDGFVDIHWTNPSDIDYAGAKIYRSTIEGQLGVEIADVKSPGNYYEDITVLNGVTYYYTVETYDNLGNTKLSNTITVTPQSARLALAGPPILTGNDYSYDSGDQTSQEEVKSGTEDQKESEDKEEENKDGKSLPYFGIVLLVVLALVGIYLLYIQNPEWFSALMFWKK